MKALLTDILQDDFAGCPAADFAARFFARPLALSSLKKISDAVRASQVEIGGKTIPAAIRIQASAPSPNGKGNSLPFLILAQLHGNEPAGLAGILLAMALAEAGKLHRDVIGIIGNPLAAEQYFEAWEKAPSARQETRDAYRCGLGENGELLPDMNRIPADFLTREATDHHTLRARDLYWVGQHISGIADIHSARGDMVCVTDHKHDRELKHSPIRAVLTGLAEAISAHASASVTVKTLKTILYPLPNIESQTGIEAGRHEAAEAPFIAASFTLSLLHGLGITSAAPHYRGENGIFARYDVRPRITYAELKHGEVKPGDLIYMTKSCQTLTSVPPRSDRLIVRREGGYVLQSVAEFTRAPAGSMEFAVYQYEEMEAIAAGEVVAVAVPSGASFKTRRAFSGIFVSKSAALYDKDPAVGPWPVSADTIGSVKFCYPCEVSEMKIDFG